MAHPVGFLFQLAWINPYTEPPDGQRVLAERFVRVEPGQGAPGCPADLAALRVPGSGYSITVQAIHEPPKEMSTEARISIRRKRLQRRMQERYPMFAEQFVQEAIARNPEYYVEGKSAGDDARREILDAEREQYERLMREL